MHTGSLRGLDYEPKKHKVSYTETHTYQPDFVHPEREGIYYEVKGRCRTYAEAKKYIWIKEQHPDIQLRFIISDPNCKAYPQTKMKFGDWLTKHGFEWCTESTVPEDWK